MFLWSRKPISLCRTAPNTFIWHISLNLINYGFWLAIYLSRKLLNTIICRILKKKKEKEKDYKNHGPTPLEKCKFCDFSNRCFYDLKSLFLYVERQQTVIFGIFSLKRKSEKNYSFEKKNHGLTPLRECKFCDLFKSMFYSLEAIFIYLKRH